MENLAATVIMQTYPFGNNSHVPAITHYKSGFTLIELVAVISIVSFIAVALLPITMPSGKSEILKARSGIVSALRTARIEAIESRSPSDFIINLREKTYSVKGRQQHQLPDSLSYQLITASSQTINTDSGSIKFSPSGGSTGGRISIIAIGHKEHVDIDWLTGRITSLAE